MTCTFVAKATLPGVSLSKWSQSSPRATFSGLLKGSFHSAHWRDSQLYPRSGQLLKVLGATSGSSNPWAEEKRCRAEEQSSQEILSYVEFKRMRYV